MRGKIATLVGLLLLCSLARAQCTSKNSFMFSVDADLSGGQVLTLVAPTTPSSFRVPLGHLTISAQNAFAEFQLGFVDNPRSFGQASGGRSTIGEKNIAEGNAWSISTGYGPSTSYQAISRKLHSFYVSENGSVSIDLSLYRLRPGVGFTVAMVGGQGGQVKATLDFCELPNDSD